MLEQDFLKVRAWRSTYRLERVGWNDKVDGLTTMNPILDVRSELGATLPLSNTIDTIFCGLGVHAILLNNIQDLIS